MSIRCGLLHLTPRITATDRSADFCGFTSMWQCVQVQWMYSCCNHCPHCFRCYNLIICLCLYFSPTSCFKTLVGSRLIAKLYNCFGGLHSIIHHHTWKILKYVWLSVDDSHFVSHMTNIALFMAWVEFQNGQLWNLIRAWQSRLIKTRQFHPCLQLQYYGYTSCFNMGIFKVSTIFKYVGPRIPKISQKFSLN